MPKNASQSNIDKPDQPCFYTVKETARHLRLCQKQIRRLIDRGELPAHRFGTALRNAASSSFYRKIIMSKHHVIPCTYTS